MKKKIYSVQQPEMRVEDRKYYYKSNRSVVSELLYKTYIIETVTPQGVSLPVLAWPSSFLAFPFRLAARVSKA